MQVSPDNMVLTRKRYWEERRNVQENKVRKVMAENPGISLTGLRKKVGGGNGNLSAIYHRVRKELAVG